MTTMSEMFQQYIALMWKEEALRVTGLDGRSREVRRVRKTMGCVWETLTLDEQREVTEMQRARD